MPGRYLLIEFDDDAAADSLRAQISKATGSGKKFRVVGLFARPGRPCKCIISPDKRSKDMVKRGDRLGWWVCTTCGKPRMGDHHLKNMLAPDEIEDPAIMIGVDALNPDINPKPFVRHAIGLSIVTFPKRVALRNKE